MRLEGKVCVITGAGSGQGRSAATSFAAEGATVVIAEIDGASGAEVAADLEGHGHGALAIEMDVSDPAAWSDLVDRVVSRFGTIDVLYNNAAVIPSDDGAVTDVDLAVWDRVMDVNVKGPMLGCRFVAPIMAADGGGSIINVASIRAYLGTREPHDAYATSKGAVVAMTKSLAVHLGSSGIRVNVIAPGTIQTEMIDVHGQDGLAERRGRYPLGRFGSPAEVADLAVYLASDESRWTTGAVFVIDGGASVTYV